MTHNVLTLSANESLKVNAMTYDVLIVNTSANPVTVTDNNGQQIGSLAAAWESILLPKGSGVYTLTNTGSSNTVVVIIYG